MSSHCEAALQSIREDRLRGMLRHFCFSTLEGACEGFGISTAIRQRLACDLTTLEDPAWTRVR